jgi:acetyl/propionyl-CoA carboxylase alpha subunit/acetyl-CoA carboxylase carboxyltransferase component
MSFERILVANRGEVAVRVLRAAAEMGLHSCAVHSEDDALSLHVRRADEVRALRGVGPAAYLDAAQIVSAATETGAQAIHPGYGFLSESADLAARCEAAGVTFVGPRVETLELLGDKGQARALAERCGVPVLPGTASATPLEEAAAAFESVSGGGAVVVKAVAGGGGRGMRVVHRAGDLEQAWERCSSEAQKAFGCADLYLERFLPGARHVEVQIVGDEGGAVSHLHERECTLQRRHQKLVEIAPSPALDEATRERLIGAALQLARVLDYRGLGTFEFLVAPEVGEGPGFVFIEANPRLQVEHTVTEAVTGVDLVRTQLELAAGRTLEELGLEREAVRPPRGHAMQVRINMETMGEDGLARPSGGRLCTFELPSGHGVRVDTFGYAGYETNPRFDSLLAKLIVHSPTDDYADVVGRAYRALCEVRIEGVATNVPFLRNLLRHPDVEAHRIHTHFIDEHLPELVAPADEGHRLLHFGTEVVSDIPPKAELAGRAGAGIDASDPLAVLHHGKRAAEAAPSTPSAGVAPEDSLATLAPMQGTIVSIDVAEGEVVRRGAPLLVMEAMKMEHVVRAELSGVVRRITVSSGEAIVEGHPVVYIEPADEQDEHRESDEVVDLERVRPDLEEVQLRHAAGLDVARPEAVARRRKIDHRTARENVEDLCDEGSFVEYGPLVIAAQRRRRSLEDLIQNTPADGMVAGIGSVNAALFGAEGEASGEGEGSRTQCVVMSYDYTVLAGTQGAQNHRKKDRMFELAEGWRLPVVFFTEGGGGRPGDTDGLGVSGLDCLAFNYFGRLSGLVPLVGVTAGRCFAGNAALLGCCDVVIATEDSNIGMGGPAMIEGGGLGIFRPEEVGPMDVQVANGVVDVAVADEAEAVEVAKQYLSFFQGATSSWSCADQRLLRSLVPENRLRVYEVRGVVETLADEGSVLELRRGFGHGMVTALARIEGRPVGIVANNPTHLAGAIDSDGADKATRFMQLCDAFDLPLLFLCDTPGIMVGPEAEKTALVRHAARMFVTAASVTVPFFTIVLRKSYGLGAQAMAGGSFKSPFFAVAWPTGEFGGMGLEGAVKLGFRKELAAVEDAEERRALYEQMVARMYEHGKAINSASHFEIDDVIDPAESRRWVVSALRSVPEPPPRSGKKRPCVDTW